MGFSSMTDTEIRTELRRRFAAAKRKHDDKLKASVVGRRQRRLLDGPVELQTLIRPWLQDLVQRCHTARAAEERR